MGDAYAINFALAAASPFRLFWYDQGDFIMVKATQPCVGSQVSEVIMEICSIIKEKQPSLLPHLGFHINSGTHGDVLGNHAVEGESPDEGYIQPQFLEEDLVFAVYKSPVKITIADLGTMPRKCPKSALVVVDAFCYSGR